MALTPEEVPCRSWDQLEAAIERVAGSKPYEWFFRGQRKASGGWNLESKESAA
jgi:hypothetical protein